MEKKIATDRQQANKTQKRSATWQRMAGWIGVFILLGCGLLRYWGAVWYQHHSNPDYAVVVTMMQHLVVGKDFPVFFYGQAYMGSLEPWVSVIWGWILGPTPLAACLGTATVACVMIVAVYEMARCVAGRLAACVAIALCAIGPVGYFHYMASPRGGYALALLLGVLLLREAVGMGALYELTWRRVQWVGFLAGLAWWNFWIVLPMVATVGLMWLWCYRSKLFHWKSLGGGLIGFFVGSAPWWIWNIRHGWGSLGMTGSSGHVGVYTAITTFEQLMTQRLPNFFQHAEGYFKAPVPSGWIVVALCIVMLGICLVPVKMSRAEACGGGTVAVMTLRLRRLVAAVVIYAACFTAAYVISSFGTVNSPRYLLPIVPVAAILVGCGIGVSYRHVRETLDPRRRALWATICGVGLLIVVGEVVGHAHDLQWHSKVDGTWTNVVKQMEAREDLPRDYYADFMHYGVNWVTQDRVVAASPFLYRYDPYFDRINESPTPGVLEDFRGFSHFLLNTDTTSKFDHFPGFRIHYDAQPPTRAVAPIPAECIHSVCDETGTDWKDVLFDSPYETVAQLSDRKEEPGICELVIQFKEPMEVCGILLHQHSEYVMDAWQVEGQETADAPWETLSGLYQDRGYYWSGERFYWGGVMGRHEKRFKTKRVHALRLRFVRHGTCETVTLRSLFPLMPVAEPMPFDFEAAALALIKHDVQTVFADQWPAQQLHAKANGMFDVSRETSQTRRNPENLMTITWKTGVALAVEDTRANRVERVLESVAADYEKVQAGGLTLWIARSDSSATPQRFYWTGGLLYVAHP